MTKIRFREVDVANIDLIEMVTTKIKMVGRVRDLGNTFAICKGIDNEQSKVNVFHCGTIAAVTFALFV